MYRVIISYGERVSVDVHECDDLGDVSAAVAWGKRQPGYKSHRVVTVQS
jgi:hypothetical protein